MHELLNTIGQWLEHTSVAYQMDNWAFLAILVSIVHYFSFFLLTGPTLMVDMRILGLAGRNQGAAEFTEQFFPWAWTGWGLAVFTGILQSTPDALILFG